MIKNMDKLGYRIKFFLFLSFYSSIPLYLKILLCKNFVHKTGANIRYKFIYVLLAPKNLFRSLFLSENFENFCSAIRAYAFNCFHSVFHDCFFRIFNFYLLFAFHTSCLWHGTVSFCLNFHC